MKLVDTFLFCIRCDVSAGCHDVDARLSAGGAGALCSLLDEVLAKPRKVACESLL